MLIKLKIKSVLRPTNQPTGICIYRTLMELKINTSTRNFTVKLSTFGSDNVLARNVAHVCLWYFIAVCVLLSVCINSASRTVLFQIPTYNYPKESTNRSLPKYSKFWSKTGWNFFKWIFEHLTMCVISFGDISSLGTCSNLTSKLRFEAREKKSLGLEWKSSGWKRKVWLG